MVENERETLEKAICALKIAEYETSVTEKDFLVYRDVYRAASDHPGDAIAIMEQANISNEEFKSFMQAETPGTAQQLCSQLIKMNERRRLKTQLEGAIKEIDEGKTDAFDIFSGITAPQPVGKRLEHIDVNAVLNRTGARKERLTGTGFKRLDAALGGGLTDGIYIISAQPGIGKTALIGQILDHIAKNGTDVLQFAYEMQADALVTRSIAREAYVKHGLKAPTGTDLYLGSISEAEWETIMDVQEEYARTIAEHTFIRECGRNYGAAEIRREIALHISQTGNKPVCLIDYLQILPRDNRQNDANAIEMLVSELKEISREFEVPIFVISSQSRATYSDKTPGLDAFKGSSSIEYSADFAAVLFAEKENNEKDLALKIVKNRMSPGRENIRKINFHFERQYGYFKEMEGASAAQPKKQRYY